MQHLTLLNAFPTFSYPLHYEQFETSVLACLKTLGFVSNIRSVNMQL